jgi:hypothetical protein
LQSIAQWADDVDLTDSYRNGISMFKAGDRTRRWWAVPAKQR